MFQISMNIHVSWLEREAFPERESRSGSFKKKEATRERHAAGVAVSPGVQPAGGEPAEWVVFCDFDGKS